MGFKLRSQSPVMQEKTGGSLSTIHTGSANTDPGVLKAKADKSKAKKSIDAYKAKAKANKNSLVKKIN